MSRPLGVVTWTTRGPVPISRPDLVAETLKTNSGFQELPPLGLEVGAGAWSPCPEAPRPTIGRPAPRSPGPMVCEGDETLPWLPNS